MSFLDFSTCKHCFTPLTNKKRLFCNKSCSASFNNTKRIRKCNYLQQTFCINCSKTFIYNKSSSCGKYCGNKCQQEFILLTQTLPKAEQGIITEHSTLKRVILLNNPYQCSFCNISTWNDKSIVLELDHIDGNSDNNFLNNLRLLCPNCHSQTETYCGRNKKNTKRNNYNRNYRSTQQRKK